MSQFAGLVEQYKTGKPIEKKQRPKRTRASVQSPAPVTKRTVKEKVGKSKDPEYTQVLTYLKKSTHNAVKAALIFDDKERDLSDLVEELLSGWVVKNQGGLNLSPTHLS